MKSAMVVHPQTRTETAAYVAAPTQALLLVGPSGSGKTRLAKQLAETVLQLAPNSFDVHSYSLLVEPVDGKAIGIEAVRELEHFLTLKVPGKQPINRAVIVSDGHALTVEAQNALLKTLEEPPQGTILIITAVHEQSLLPTIRSRVQVIPVRRPPASDLDAYFQSKGFTADDIKQAYAMSSGLPGLMQALLDESEHPVRAAARQARHLLSQPLFERLVAVDALAKQRELAIDTVSIIQQMAHLSLQTASGPAARRWQKILRASYDAGSAIAANGQLKLVLTDMALRF